MKNKKARLFVWISLILLALSALTHIIYMTVSYYEAKNDPSGDRWQATNLLAASIILTICVFIPRFSSGLSFVRSVYKVLTREPTGGIKLCYILSASLAFLAVALLWPFYAGIGPYLNAIHPNFALDILTFTEWPLFIVSFILGSIKAKHDDPSLHEEKTK